MATASLQPGVAACVLPLGICKVPGNPLIVGNWYPGKFDVPCDQGVCNYLNIQGLTDSATRTGRGHTGPWTMRHQHRSSGNRSEDGEHGVAGRGLELAVRYLQGGRGTNSPNWDENPPRSDGLCVHPERELAFRQQCLLRYRRVSDKAGSAYGVRLQRGCRFWQAQMHHGVRKACRKGSRPSPRLAANHRLPMGRPRDQCSRRRLRVAPDADRGRTRM